MKKKIVVLLCMFVLIVIIGILVFKKDNKGDIMDGPGMVNEVSSYSVDVKERGEFPGEDVYVYDEGNLVLLLNDETQPQYLFALYENYVILDSGTSASQREMLVYDIPSGKLIYQTDYYPGENGLVLDDNNITFYKEVNESGIVGELPQCESEYDNGYIEKYGYTIGENQASGLGDIQCAYFE